MQRHGRRAQLGGGVVSAGYTRQERVRFVLDAYLIGVDRGLGYERAHPGEHRIDAERNRAIRCGCWLCRAEDVGFDVGAAAERAS